MIHPILPAHYAEILKNNQEFVHWLSPLDEAELMDLLALSPYARQISNGQGVLIAYTSDTIYENENIEWLQAEFDDFVYIDRVIIAKSAQGKGYGQKLYTDLAEFAARNGYSRLVCEVNTRPDNPGSHIFHEKLGFKACGEADICGGSKRVRYYEKQVSTGKAGK